MKKILVRSSSHFVVLTVLQQGGFLEAVGLDPTFELADMAVNADGQLLAGEVDMISGSHHTPYLHYDDGKQMVYLAQTTNQVQESFVTSEPIEDLSEMRGKRLALSPLLKPGEKPSVPSEGHPRANIQIMLERAGIAETVEFLGYGPSRSDPSEKIQSVANGFADGAFAGGGELAKARELGLNVLTLAPLPMISGVTCTTTWDKIEEHTETQAFERFVLALHRAVKYFKTEREGTIKILSENADALGFRDDRQLVGRYDRTAKELDPRLAPTSAAIGNAFHIAELERPGIGDRVNPLALWDLHFVRKALIAEGAQR